MGKKGEATMRKIYFLLALLLLLPQYAAAKPSEHLIYGPQLNAAECNTAGSKLAINVIQKIIGDVDSGEAGNDWAVDEYQRQIHVWQLTSNTFCAVVKYMGSFVTVMGPSPGALDPDTNDTVAPGITGTFEGGYRSTVFIGTLKDPPDYRTRGNIGTFNYGCVPNVACTNRTDWRDFYFSSHSGFALEWWGWVYHAGDNGSWVNSIDGNSGDIN
jgi:hypothetical protein